MKIFKLELSFYKMISKIIRLILIVLLIYLVAIYFSIQNNGNMDPEKFYSLFKNLLRSFN